MHFPCNIHSGPCVSDHAWNLEMWSCIAGGLKIKVHVYVRKSGNKSATSDTAHDPSRANNKVVWVHEYSPAFSSMSTEEGDLHP